MLGERGVSWRGVWLVECCERRAASEVVHVDFRSVLANARAALGHVGESGLVVWVADRNTKRQHPSCITIDVTSMEKASFTTRSMRHCNSNLDFEEH